MDGTVLLFGGLTERDESQRLILQRAPQLRVEGAGRPWEVVERAIEGKADVVVVLQGPIAEHERRLELIQALVRHGYTGRILACGAFLTEKHDAVAAGAHYAFDPGQQRLEEVVWRAVQRPTLAADHPYLRALFVGEWAQVAGYGEALPGVPPAALLAAVSCHPHEAFWEQLAAYARAHTALRCIVVEDVADEAAAAEALASGVQPYVVLAEEGLQKVLALGREFLHEAWLARLSAA